MEWVRKYQNLWKKIGIAVAVGLAMKYLAPLVIPFLIAGAIVYWCRPLLEALKRRLAFHLKYGAVVELEGIGTFSVSLKCPPLTEEKDIKPKHVRFSKVVFRCSKELRSGLKYMEIERSDGGSRLKVLPSDKRKANILRYLQQNETISSSYCRGLNGCSKYMALKDLDELRKEGKIVRLGYRSNAQYGLAKQ